MGRLYRVVFVLLIGLYVASVVVSQAWAGAPTGTSPNDPLMIPTGSQTIAPSTTLWFYFDYATDRGQSKANVALDDNGAAGMQLAVYTSAGVAAWLQDPATEPAGMGTPYRDTETDAVVHDLYWSGGSKISDRFYLAVTNTSSLPVSFLLSVTGYTVALYPPVPPTPTPTLPVPFTVTPAPVGTIQGKVLFETGTGGAIFTVNGDGSNLTLVSHGIDPSWSPDGNKITFARWDNVFPGVYTANADGSNEQLVFGAPRVRWPRFSPDGKYIIFAQDKSKSDRNIIWKLGLIELATGKLTEPQCSQLCFVPSWNPDSSTVLFADPGVGIMSTAIAGGPPSIVLGPTGRYWDTAANISRPILHMPEIQDALLSPDGKSIVYAQEAHDRWELNSVNADGSNQMGLTSPDPVLYYIQGIATHNVAPVWSRDSRQILFLSDRNGKWEFFVTNRSGQNITQVLKNVSDMVPLNFSYNNERMVDWTN